MKDLVQEAKAPNTFSYNIFVSQLPISVQRPLRDWLDAQGEVGTKEARKLLIKVKSALVQKEIPMDFGYRELGRIALLEQENGPVDPVKPESKYQNEVTNDQDTVYVTAKEEYRGATSYRGYGRGRGKAGRSYSGNQLRNPKNTRYICNSDRHFMARRPDRHCPKCGEKGHPVWDCHYTGTGRKVLNATTRHAVVRNAAVMIPVKWDNKAINVLIETGADPSVVDRDTFERMGISYTAKEDRVYGLGRASLAVCGTARVSIDVGDNRWIT